MTIFWLKMLLRGFLNLVSVDLSLDCASLSDASPSLILHTRIRRRETSRSDKTRSEDAEWSRALKQQSSAVDGLSTHRR